MEWSYGLATAGYLTVTELKDLLTQMDFQNPTSKHVDNMLKQAGLENRDLIDFPELLMLVTMQMNVSLDSTHPRYLREQNYSRVSLRFLIR